MWSCNRIINLANNNNDKNRNENKSNSNYSNNNLMMMTKPSSGLETSGSH